MNVLAVLVTKVFIATGLAVSAEIVRRRTRHPEIAYAAWACVLVVLILPSVFSVPMPQSVTASLQSGWSFISEPYTSEVSADSRTGQISDSIDTLTSPFEVLCWVAGLLWLSGFLAILAHRIQVLRRVEQLAKLAVDAPLHVQQRCKCVSRELKVRNVPRMATADGRFSPFLWDPSLGEACIVIPTKLIRQLSEASLDAVLRHELMHLRRRDAWRHRLQFLVTSLWWWLPIASLARRRLLMLEELCVDVAVVRMSPGHSRDYARALLDTDEFLAGESPDSLLVVPALVRGSFLGERIASIVSEQPSRLTTRSQVTVCCGVAASLMLGFFSTSLTPLHADRAVAEASDQQSIKPQLTDKLQRARPSVALSGFHESVATLPDNRVVSVQQTDREIVLEWPRSSADSELLYSNDDKKVADCGVQSIRLIRVSEDGIEPRVWRIAREKPTAEETPMNPAKVDWLFGFLARNNDIVDCDGTRHHHPKRAANVV